MIKVNRNVYHMHNEALGGLVRGVKPDFSYTDGAPVWIVEVQDVDKSTKIEYIFSFSVLHGIDKFCLANRYTKGLIEDFISRTSKNSSAASSQIVAPKCCDCGAIHTSFPNNHYNWCSVRS